MQLLEINSQLQKPNKFAISPELYSPNGHVMAAEMEVVFPGSELILGDHYAMVWGREIHGYNLTTEGARLLPYEPPSDEHIGGVFVVLYTHPKGDWFRRNPFILIQKENMTNDEVDKQANDWCTIAETRRRDDQGRPIETLEQTVWRGLMEEGNLDPSVVQLRNSVIGHYLIQGIDSFGHQTWVQARYGYVPWEVLEHRTIAPNDGETRDTLWVSPILFQGGFPKRAGVSNIVSHWLAGWRDIVAVGSPSDRRAVIKSEE